MCHQIRHVARGLISCEEQNERTPVVIELLGNHARLSGQLCISKGEGKERKQKLDRLECQWSISVSECVTSAASLARLFSRCAEC